MAKRQRDAGKQAFWSEAIRRHASSGLSVRAFCQQERLTASAFYDWRRTLAQRDCDAELTASTPAFVPAIVSEQGLSDASIVIKLAGGDALQLPAAISASRLAELVHALETRGGR